MILRLLLILMLSCNTAFAAIEFDGTDDSLACGSGSSIDNLTTRTYSAFVKLSSLANGYYYIVEKNNGVNGPEFAIDITAGVPSLAMWFSGTVSGGYWTAPITGLAVNEWHHYAVTFNISSISNDPVMYVDGVSKTVSEGTTPSGSFESDAAQTLNIGGSSSAGNYLPGTIRDVSVYNTILTSTEIANIYKLNGFPYSTGLVAYWTINDGAVNTSADGDTVSDSSGTNTCTGNDGANNTGLTWRSVNTAKAIINSGLINQWK